MNASRSCVIVVENLPVPFDRRVWQEAQALTRAGWRVSVICPLTEAFPERFEWLEFIAIYRHPLPVQARGKWAFAIEYGAAFYHEVKTVV